jgi:hypothetical protein
VTAPANADRPDRVAGIIPRSRGLLWDLQMAAEPLVVLRRCLQTAARRVVPKARYFDSFGSNSMHERWQAKLRTSAGLTLVQQGHEWTCQEKAWCGTPRRRLSAPEPASL